MSNTSKDYSKVSGTIVFCQMSEPVKAFVKPGAPKKPDEWKCGIVLTDEDYVDELEEYGKSLDTLLSMKKVKSAEFEDKIRSWAIPFASLLIDSIAKKAAVPLPLSFAKATENLKLKNDIIGKFVAHSVTVDDSTFCEVMEAFSAFNTFKRMANVKGRAVTEEQFTLYLSTNVAPLRTRLNNNKEENGWGIVIKTCGGDRGYGFN